MRVIEKLKRPIQLKPAKMLQATPCALEMTTMFNCWRAMSVDAAECGASARALAQCMTSKGKSGPSSASTTQEINRWLLKVSKRKQL
ncbi:hypothetical protein HK105_206904 [Polyrhizophydium stewartii]|uniref:37S ribosomal protein mrp10, mitochondrial n=1 Tax=Polyrhizophydium stewartii TaxID=2732419 RepID=A0ABR4N247_9FUNG|nr:hypothetical protein HK105_003878 [Polyrhizophydium stewartii]